MTAYRNFVQDFPSRCATILDAYEYTARATDREVTLSLAIASAAFVIPFERLRPDATSHIAPDRCKSCVKQLGKLLGQPFPSWAGGGWQQHFVPGSRIRGHNVEQWLPPEELQPVSFDRSVGSVLAVIRNALAHGNIFTSSSAGEQIGELIFLSKQRDSDQFAVVATRPASFLQVLRRWLLFLSELDLPPEPTQPLYHEFPPAFSGGSPSAVEIA